MINALFVFWVINYTYKVALGCSLYSFYNNFPRYQKITHAKNSKILLKYRKLSTPVAIIKGAYRESQTVVLTDLENLEKHSDKLGMISTVIVGNSSTYNYKNLMINPRGYQSKYNLQEETNPELKVK